MDDEARLRKRRKRQTNILHGFVDLFAISLILLIFAMIYILVPPYNQGFYCDDRTIMKPYKDDTVPMWSIGIYAGLVPVVVFLMVEMWVCQGFVKQHTGSKRKRTLYLGSIFHSLFLFGLGVAATFLLTEVGKRSYGRLRPHFFEVCQPDWSKIQCVKRLRLKNGDIYEIPNYITDYECLGDDNDKIKEARISFPSGHSSFVTYSFCFLLVYFEARVVCASIRFLKPILQCSCVCIIIFTCLSRITDHKHHWGDVIGGATIGCVVALFITLRVGTPLWSYGIAEQHQGAPGLLGTMTTGEEMRRPITLASNSRNEVAKVGRCYREVAEHVNQHQTSPGLTSVAGRSPSVNDIYPDNYDNLNDYSVNMDSFGDVRASYDAIRR